MMEWSILITRADPSDSDAMASRFARSSDDLFDLYEELAECAPVISFDGSTMSIRVAYRAGDPFTAARRAATITEKALANVEPAIAEWPVTHIEATEWTQFERDLEEPNVPAVVGVAELASLLGVSRQRVSELARAAHFPKPFVELASGPVWLEPNVKDFLVNWDRKPGRPRKAAG